MENVAIEEVKNLNAPDMPQVLNGVWNLAFPPDLLVSPRLMGYNLHAGRGERKALWLARVDGRAVGFALASALPDLPAFHPPEEGWLEALAVDARFHRRGIHRALLLRAENWLRRQGVRVIHLGGGMRPFFPGLPAELNSERFFLQHGYRPEAEVPTVWDMARDLGDGLGLAPLNSPALRPATPADMPALLTFFAESFPGRWQYEALEYLRGGGPLGDFMILRLGERVEGFCWMTTSASVRPLERFYLQRLPRPWGQLGPLGISPRLRGQGWGGWIVQAGIEHLQAAGVRGCVIDWTELVDFYRRFGFKPYREYRLLTKVFGPES